MIILQHATTIEIEPAHVDRDVDIAIDGNTIVAVGKNLSAEYPEAACHDMTGLTVMPGLVCSHNHFYSALARGITTGITPSSDFVQVLQHLWWRLDTAIDVDILKTSGEIGVLEAIRSGITAVVDHHASPSCIEGSLGILKTAFEQYGLRGILCYETTDRHGEAGMEAGVAENASFIEAVNDTDPESRLVEAAIGGHAPFTLNDRALDLLGQLAEKSGRGFHVHVAEDRYDVGHSHHQYAKDPLERLLGFGLLSDKAIIVHGVHLTDGDIKILNAANGFLVHNTRSNMNNTVGYMEKLPAVHNVALGTDGIGSDMLTELQVAYFKHRDASGTRWPDTFARYLQNGNRILERYFDAKFGRIEPGYRADLTVMDYDSPTPLMPENIAGHHVFGMSSRDVHSVMVNGKFVYRDRRFPFDVKPIYAEAAQAAKRLWDTM